MITADSTCDLSPELLERFHIKTIPLTIQLGDESFLDGQDFSPDKMYKRYHQDGTLPKTAACSIQQFMDFFSQFTAAGYEVVHLDISSELSCSYANARLAAQELEGVYPVDSQMLSTGVGLLAIEAAECRDRGMSAEEIARHLDELKDKVDTSFVLDTLEFMWKGGRCSAVASLGANLLKLKPALEMKDGKLGVYKKYRGSITAVYQQYIKERLAGKSSIYFFAGRCKRGTSTERGLQTGAKTGIIRDKGGERIMNQVKTGGLIRAARLKNGMTQLQLAEKLSVSDKAVSKWERGVSQS